MEIDESKTLTFFPFNKLTLPANETVILTEFNPTFHRDNLQAALISNKALYLGTGGCEGWGEGLPEFFKRSEFFKWRRFPLTEIECATFLSREYSVVRLLLEDGAAHLG